MEHAQADTAKMGGDEHEHELSLVAERLDRFVSLYAHASSGHYRRTLTAIDVASPLPLGCFAFAFGVGFYMNLYAGNLPLMAQFLNFPVCIFIGGITMITAGVACAFRRESFGFSSFVCFGWFFVTIGIYGTLQAQGTYSLASLKGMAALAGLFAVLAFLLLLVSVILCVLLPVLLFFLFMMFVLLACGLNGRESTLKAGGWWGIITAMIAFYAGCAFFFEEAWGMEVLPIYWTRIAKIHTSKIWPPLAPGFEGIGVPKKRSYEIRSGDNDVALSQPSLSGLSSLRPHDV